MCIHVKSSRLSVVRFVENLIEFTIKISIFSTRVFGVGGSRKKPAAHSCEVADHQAVSIFILNDINFSSSQPFIMLRFLTAT